MGLLGDVLSTFKSKSLVFIILVVLVILYVLSIYLTMFEKEITIGQKYVRPAGRYSHYQIVDKYTTPRYWLSLRNSKTWPVTRSCIFLIRMIAIVP